MSRWDATGAVVEALKWQCFVAAWAAAIPRHSRGSEQRPVMQYWCCACCVGGTLRRYDDKRKHAAEADAWGTCSQSGPWRLVWVWPPSGSPVPPDRVRVQYKYASPLADGGANETTAPESTQLSWVRRCDYSKNSSRQKSPLSLPVVISEQWTCSEPYDQRRYRPNPCILNAILQVLRWMLGPAWIDNSVYIRPTLYNFTRNNPRMTYFGCHKIPKALNNLKSTKKRFCKQIQNSVDTFLSPTIA